MERYKIVKLLNNSTASKFVTKKKKKKNGSKEMICHVANILLIKVLGLKLKC